MKKLIRKNTNGQISHEIENNVFHIEFGNVQFALQKKDYLEFEQQLKNISNELTLYNSSEKVKILVKSIGITLILSNEELLSLSELFGFKTAKLISFKMNISYSMN